MLQSLLTAELNIVFHSSEDTDVVHEIHTEEDSENEIDGDIELEKFVAAVDTFKNKIISSYGKDFKKRVKYLTKHLEKISRKMEN